MRGVWSIIFRINSTKKEKKRKKGKVEWEKGALRSGFFVLFCFVLFCWLLAQGWSVRVAGKI